MAGKKIIQVVGFQNSGKTTLIERLIKACKSNGMTVGTIKHHGHGGKPDRLVLNKDSEKHRLAGASVTAVEGEGSLHIEATMDRWELEDIVQIYGQFPINIIFIEGYKKMDFPKVVMLRDERDEFLLDDLQNIIAVISHKTVSRTPSVPSFTAGQTDQFIDWFLKKINED